MNTAQFWSPAEEATLLKLTKAGATLPQLIDALPGRSELAIRKRRTILTKRPRHRPAHTGPAPLARRIAALEATVEAAMAERRVDWELVDEYLGGLEYLKGKVAR